MAHHYLTYSTLAWMLYLNMMAVGKLSIICLPLPDQVNDFIDPNTYTLSYCSVDDPYTIINELG